MNRAFLVRVGPFLLATCAHAQEWSISERTPVGLEPSAIAQGDLDGDGLPELVTANDQGGSLSVLANDGAGAFPSAVHHPLSSASPAFGTPDQVVLADVDLDGRLDAVATRLPGNRAVLLSDAQGALTAPDYQPVLGPIDGMLVRDLDGDGLPDFAWVGAIGGAVYIAPGDGLGGFGAEVKHCVWGVPDPNGFCNTGQSNPFDLIAVDLDEDGWDDLVTANGFGQSVSVLLSDANGGFGPGVLYPAPNRPGAIDAADLDSDGDLDVVALSSIGQPALLLRGDGVGGLSSWTNVPGLRRRWARATDVDADGHADLVSRSDPLTVHAHELEVFHGDGTGLFPSAWTFDTGHSPWDAELVDLNGDGTIDAASADFFDATVSVLLAPSVPPSGMLLQDVRVDLALVGGGTQANTKIGTLRAPARTLLPPGQSVVDFTFEPSWSDLDNCYDFRWINVLEEYWLWDEFSLENASQSSDPVLGLLPALDPRPGQPYGQCPASCALSDASPFYWNDDGWMLDQLCACAGGPDNLHVEGLGSGFNDSPSDATDDSELGFHTFLVATSVGATGIPAQSMQVLGGVRWVYRNESKQIARVELTPPDAAPILQALLSGQVAGSGGFPGYPSWSAFAGGLLGDCPGLAALPPGLSVSAPAPVEFPIRAGVAYQGQAGSQYTPDPYFLVGSASGTSPGLPLAPGLTLPLNLDAYLVLSLASANTPEFEDFARLLDPVGHGLARLNLGSLPASAVGLTLDHALVIADSTSLLPLKVLGPVAVQVLP